MPLFRSATERTRRLLTYVEYPELFRVRNSVIHETYLALRQPWVQALGIQTILDIGANVGQSAETLNRVFPQARIYSFEPLPDCFAQLQARMGHIPHFQAFNIGLGEEAGSLSFQENEFRPSSSFLPLANEHKTAFPFAAHTKTIDVKVERLDTVCAQIELAPDLLIKIDVQGYEDRVLRGGDQVVRQAKLLLIETTFKRLYEGQALFYDICTLLNASGFDFVGNIDQTSHPESGEMLFADSVFLRRTT